MKVSPIMLLKTHIEKMSETGHATICMKTMNLEASRHYMYDKKYVSENARERSDRSEGSAQRM